MNGICLIWSRGRLISPSLPIGDDRYLNLSSQKRPTGRNLGGNRLVRRSGTTSRGTVVLVFRLRMRKGGAGKFSTLLLTCQPLPLCYVLSSARFWETRDQRFPGFLHGTGRRGPWELGCHGMTLTTRKLQAKKPKFLLKKLKRWFREVWYQLYRPTILLALRKRLQIINGAVQ